MDEYCHLRCGPSGESSFKATARDITALARSASWPDKSKNDERLALITRAAGDVIYGRDIVWRELWSSCDDERSGGSAERPHI